MPNYWSLKFRLANSEKKEQQRQRKQQQMRNETSREINKWRHDLYSAHLINVSLDPVARWTIKVSNLDVSFSQNKCEGGSEAEDYDRNSRQ